MDLFIDIKKKNCIRLFRFCKVVFFSSLPQWPMTSEFDGFILGCVMCTDLWKFMKKGDLRVRTYCIFQKWTCLYWRIFRLDYKEDFRDRSSRRM